MIRDDVAYLIEEDPKAHGAFDQVDTSGRMVFCQVRSVNRADFWQAHSIGLEPEIVLVLADAIDYQDERLVGYNGKIYEVLRTYRNGISLEITLQRARAFDYVNVIDGGDCTCSTD